MKKIIQFHIYKGEEFFIAESVDLPIVTQAKSLDELVKNINEAVELHLEGEDFNSFDLDPRPSILANIELNNIYA